MFNKPIVACTYNCGNVRRIILVVATIHKKQYGLKYKPIQVRNYPHNIPHDEFVSRQTTKIDHYPPLFVFCSIFVRLPKSYALKIWLIQEFEVSRQFVGQYIVDKIRHKISYSLDVR